jgi:hypothetical protein
MHQMFHLYLNYQKLLVLPEALLLLGLPEVLVDLPLLVHLLLLVLPEVLVDLPLLVLPLLLGLLEVLKLLMYHLVLLYR